MSNEQMKAPSSGVRAYQSASGTYLHGADLAYLFRSMVDKVDPITALSLPRVADVIERLAVNGAAA